ncbi:MAG: PQQ-dependent sugar dehydrogenase [Candidatus Doudnabacteria bacterium]|nr:PQQ-dependent sugar dehydrogenase [Candidatus Doudnabacteria bacterium]
MKNFLFNLAVALIAGAALIAAIFYWSNLRGVWPAVKPPTEKIEDILNKPVGKNETGMPLKLPDGFSISIFAKDLPGARVLAFDPLNNMWVARTKDGAVALLEIQDGTVRNQNDIFRNLRNPHGLAFDNFALYIAEEHRVSSVAAYSEDSLRKIADLPSEGGGHFTRTLGLGPDGKLYVSIGSSCNVCNEGNPRRAAIYSMSPDGSDFNLFAKGLRNTVFFTWDKDGRMWGADMGRDLLGDDVPPDEINILEQGKDYGWPICYGKSIHDSNFDKNQYIRDPCSDKASSFIDLQAHSAPLGLAFIPKGFGPADWENDLIVAYHGSWNRSEPTGYKLVRIKLDGRGNYEGTEDFVTGWLQGNNSLGRPVDVIFKGQDMFVSDDKAGVIYKVTYETSG